jgi:isopentenyl diphosphate isomerase/L-lactate dehydrogenase-like FMN-dependent dehydrogenase
VELFGQRLPTPAITAPVGSFILIGDDAERQVAEGSERAGAMMFISQAAKFDPKGWRNAAKSPLVFMAYMNRGREEVSNYAKTAEDLGFAAVGITMDTVKPVKIGDEVPLSTKDGKPRKGHKSTPKDIEWMKQQVDLPVVVKGIMGADDARAAVSSGADALVVSNHGGRILDFNRSALEALPEVVEAVSGKVPVLLDSGIRSGGDIVKAMALGAKAVLVGRPVAWGVGAFGARGVERVFAILSEEMQRVLTMAGVARLRDVTKAILFREEQGGLRAL